MASVVETKNKFNLKINQYVKKNHNNFYLYEM